MHSRIFLKRVPRFYNRIPCGLMESRDHWGHLYTGKIQIMSSVLYYFHGFGIQLEPVKYDSGQLHE